MKKLFTNGTIVTDSEVCRGNLLVEDGVIRAFGPDVQDPEAEVIDIAGKLLLPGGVDVHTHMDLDVGFTRAIDDFYDGTVAAVCGGTTTIVDHMAFAPGDVPLKVQSDVYHGLADGNAVIDYGFHGVLQLMNEDKINEMAELMESEGMTSFKAYMTYGSNMITDQEMLRILKKAKEIGAIIPVHCEDDSIVEATKKYYGDLGMTEAKYHPLSRPAEAEGIAVKKLLALAYLADEAPVYVVHLSSKEGLAGIAAAKARGQKNIGVETCPQYLALTDAMYEDPKEGLKAIMSPPLRKQEDVEALWQALKEEKLIDVIATDHCPFTFAEQKQRGKDDFRMCPNGGPGVEERYRVVFSEGVMKGRIDLNQFVRYICTNPAKAFGIYPKKGTIAAGSDADLVVIDPEREMVLTHDVMHGASDYTCYEGMKIKGVIEKVYSKGEEVVRDNEFLGHRGDGRYLRRGKSALIAE